MKNKLKKTMTALCAALILMGGFSVPAYAQGAATEPPAGNATNDSGVIVEEKEETPPLTPKGNATLVDDYGGNKQLITVATKSGNYFYIVIDRSGDTENVYFLNLVDEADLMALMENGGSAAACSCKDKCEAGAVNTACAVCKTNMTECMGKEKATEKTPEPDPTPDTSDSPDKDGGEKKSGSGLVVIVLLLLMAGCGALYWFKLRKKKPDTKGPVDLDDYDYGDEDEEYENEDDADEPEETEDADA